MKDSTCGYVQTESGNRPGAESPTIYGSVGPSAQAGVTPRARPYAAPPPGTRIQSPNHSPFGGIPDEVMGGVDTCPPLYHTVHHMLAPTGFARRTVAPSQGLLCTKRAR